MPSPAPSILWPTSGSIIYHHVPITQADYDNGFWYFSRSSLGNEYDYETVWRMVPNGQFSQMVTFILPGIAGFKLNIFGDGNWQLDCAGRSNTTAQTEWSSNGEEALFIPFQYQIAPPDPVPTASFTNTPKEFFESKTVQFNDTSSGNPTSWSWKFRESGLNGNWVEFSTLQNPTKDFSV